MNSDIPYDKYIKHREKGRKGKGRYYNKHLTEGTSFYMTPKMKEKIDRLMEKQLFPNKAEFFRHLIIKFFEDNPEWFK